MTQCNIPEDTSLEQGYFKMEETKPEWKIMHESALHKMQIWGTVITRLVWLVEYQEKL
jgi:hypothetical protein